MNFQLEDLYQILEDRHNDDAVLFFEAREEHIIKLFYLGWNIVIWINRINHEFGANVIAIYDNFYCLKTQFLSVAEFEQKFDYILGEIGWGGEFDGVDIANRASLLDANNEIL